VNELIVWWNLLLKCLNFVKDIFGLNYKTVGNLFAMITLIKDKQNCTLMYIKLYVYITKSRFVFHT